MMPMPRRRHRSSNVRCSSDDMIQPVGLDGDAKKTAFVRDPIAATSVSISSRHGPPASRRNRTNFGIAPATSIAWKMFGHRRDDDDLITGAHETLHRNRDAEHRRSRYGNSLEID